MELQRNIRNTYTVIFTDAQYNLYTPISRELDTLYRLSAKAEWKGHHICPDCFQIEGAFIVAVSSITDKPATKTMLSRGLKQLYKQLQLSDITNVLIDGKNPLLKNISCDDITALLDGELKSKGIEWAFCVQNHKPEQQSAS